MSILFLLSMSDCPQGAASGPGDRPDRGGYVEPGRACARLSLERRPAVEAKGATLPPPERAGERAGRRFGPARRFRMLVLDLALWFHSLFDLRIALWKSGLPAVRMERRKRGQADPEGASPL